MVDIKILKEIALSNVLNPTTEYFYRYVCRWYSKTFSTELCKVYTLPPQDVMLAYFEEGYETMDDEDKMVEAARVIDPDFDQSEEESIEDFISMIESEEQAKRDKKSINAGSVKKTEPQTQAPNAVVRTYDDDVPDDESGL